MQADKKRLFIARLSCLLVLYQYVNRCLNAEKIFTQYLNNSDILSKFAFGKQNVMLAGVVSSCIGNYGLTYESKHTVVYRYGLYGRL